MQKADQFELVTTAHACNVRVFLSHSVLISVRFLISCYTVVVIPCVNLFIVDPEMSLAINHSILEDPELSWDSYTVLVHIWWSPS